MSKYPEHEKLKLVQRQSQAIHEFVAWLQEQHGIGLARYIREGAETIVWEQTSTTNLVAEFLEIDQVALENEKRAMIEEMRKANTTRRG